MYCEGCKGNAVLTIIMLVIKKKRSFFCYPFSRMFLFYSGEESFCHISVLSLCPSPLVFLLLVFYSALD